MASVFCFRKVLLGIFDLLDLIFGIVSWSTDSGIEDRCCQTVRISVILISNGNVSKIIGKYSFFQSKLCDSSKSKDSSKNQRNIHLVFQFASVFRRFYQNDQKDQNCNAKKYRTDRHLGLCQVLLCNAEAIGQVLYIRACKRCDTVEKKNTVYDSQKQP